MNITIGLVSIVALTLATAFFVAQEFAYVAVDRGRLAELAGSGDSAARRALTITERLSFTLSGAQLGITVTALLVGYVSEPYLGAGLADLLTDATGLPRAVSLSVSVLAALVLSTIVQMVIGELAPKNYAIARPVDLARWLSRPTALYLTVAGPLIRLFDGASTRLLRAVGIEPVEELPHGATPQDLHRIIGDSHAGGLLDEDLSQLLDRGLAFRHLTAEQAMTPRVDMHTVPADATLDVVAGLMGTGHSRFPVTGESVDDVLGVVGTRELLDVEAAHRHRATAAEVMTDAVRVPTSLALPEVLAHLRHAHQQLAVVVDEYGGVAGVVTLEDLAEEVVGDIRDESDQPVGAVSTLPESHGLPGRMRLDEIADATEVTLPESEDYDTVGGLVLARLGRTARVDDEVDVDWTTTVQDTPVARRARIRVVAVSRHVPETVVVTDLGPVEDLTAGAVPALREESR